MEKPVLGGVEDAVVGGDLDALALSSDSLAAAARAVRLLDMRLSMECCGRGGAAGGGGPGGGIHPGNPSGGTLNNSPGGRRGTGLGMGPMYGGRKPIPG